MSTIEKQIDVDVPVRTVYNQWTQFEEFPHFMQGVERVEQVTDTLTHWVTKIGGVTREFDAQIVDQQPDRLVHWRALDGPRQEGEVTFEPSGNGTRVRLFMDYDPEGFVEKTGDVLGAVDRRVEGDLLRFKEFIEERGAETGGWRGAVEAGQTAPTTGPESRDVAPPEAPGAEYPGEAGLSGTERPGATDVPPASDDFGQPRPPLP